MALNLLRTAKKNAVNDIETGKHYKKEELADQWLTIERVGLVDKVATKMGKPIIDQDTGEVQRLFWADFRFIEYPDGFFRGFTSLTATVAAWVEEAGGDIDAVNEELAANPIQINMYSSKGRAWLFEVRPV